jgi:hypothetical protein
MADVRNINRNKENQMATETPNKPGTQAPAAKPTVASIPVSDAPAPVKSSGPSTEASNKGAATVKAQAAAAKLPPLPKLPKGARKAKPAKPCGCGCGNMTAGGQFIAGHDGRLKGLAIRVQRGVMTYDEVEAFAGKGTRDAVHKLLAPGVPVTSKTELAAEPAKA